MLVVIGICGAVCGCSSQNAAVGPARALFREAINVLSTRPLGCDRVDWLRVAAELEITVAPDAPLAAAYPLIQNAVSRLGDPHSRFLPPSQPVPAATPQPAGTTASRSDSSNTTRGEIPHVPSARMLDKEIAYVVVPLCTAADRTSLLEYAATLRREIAQAALAKPRGWLVELRFNGGGNCWPMLLGLWPLLGDGVQVTGVAADGEITRIGCDANASWLDRDNQPRYEQLRLDPSPTDVLVRSAPMAVLIGPWTMSAGEMVAIAFRGKARTRLFGEHTGGYTTTTTEFPLSDGSMLVVSVETMGDRGGQRAPQRIPPDVPVKIGDWPFVQDQVAQTAITWLLAESGEQP
ncbi:MAG: hypothetical protein JNG88_01010 [Phycisphaerales bacterium]|nr:hypothetical protein [Phycisphaerales bacterium]